MRAIFGGVDVVPFVLCNVEVTTNFGGGCGAIAGCHCSLLRFGGRGTNHFGCSGRGVRRVTRGVDMVPSLRSGRGAIAGH